MTCLAFTIASSILLAQNVLGRVVNNDRSECPKGWASTQLNNNEIHCCYGSITVNNNEGYCCVHSGGDSMIAVDISDSCFPFCSETANHNDESAPPSQQCVDNVPFSASDYSQRVSVASKLAAATQTSGSRTSSNTASATNSDSSSGTSATADSSSIAIAIKNPAPAVTHGAVQVGGVCQRTASK